MKYEIVFVLSARISQDEHKHITGNIQEALWNTVQDVDDMGKISLSYPLSNGDDTAFFISYYLEASGDDIAHIKTKLKFLEWVQKYALYRLEKGKSFMPYKELVKETQKLLDQKEDDDSLMVKKEHVLNDASLYNLLSWKNTLLLKKYISRFQYMKPRKFTTHSVKIQKKLRKHIIRSRELGLLPYVNTVIPH